MPDYHDQIKMLEDEIQKTQYNKATQHHVGLLKAKIAKLREKAESRAGGGGKQEGYQVRKTGDGTIILLGFPSTGKSTLLNALCGTQSETAGYAFTTLTVVPGTLKYRHARIQILDVPGIVAGASSGRGRGKEVLACIRSADVCLLIADCLRPQELQVIRREAYNVGIRLDSQRPDVQIRKTGSGGINVLTTCPLKKIDERTIGEVMREFKINNADIVIREDITVDQLIDCIEGNKKYMPSIVAFNKTDLVEPARKRSLQKEYSPDIFVSAQTGEGLDMLKELIYERLDLMNVYLKEPGKEADMDEPLVMFTRSTIRHLCEKLHKDFVGKFKFARVWGPSAKFDGQKLMLGHMLKDGDVVELHMK